MEVLSFNNDFFVVFVVVLIRAFIITLHFAALSFIATSRLLSTFASLLAPDGHALVLVKPQFEAGRAEVSKGKGIIDDPAIWVRVLHEFIDAAADAALPVIDLAISPIRGGKGGSGNGNVEFLAHLRHQDILNR